MTAAGSNANGFQWSYDSFGNRLAQVVTAGSGVNLYQSFSTATNRPDGLAFDAAGNALNTGGAVPQQLQYDAEERVSSAAGVGYVYDAMGQRAAKYVNGSLSNAYFYDLAGHVVTELSGTFSLNRREVYAGSRHLATYDSSGNLAYVLADWIGTERARATSSGTLCQQTTSQPFGDNEQISGTCSPPTTAFFTGKERDNESGLDYFGARYYSSAMGRMMSPDWAAKAMPVPYARLEDPQSLNLYAYVGNNPLRYTDPTGHYLVNCGANDKACNKAADGFEKQRQKDLKSKDIKVRNAAGSWGDRGQDNHINVSFVSQQQMDADAHTAPGYRTDAMVTPGTTADHTPTVTAEFSENLTGSDLGQTISHEGQHIEDDMTFLNSFNPATGKYNPFANFSHFDTEFQAFGAGAGVKPYSMFPSGPGGYQQLTDYIRRAYPNADQQVFSPRAFPQ